MEMDWLCTYLEKVTLQLCYLLFQLAAVCRRCCIICSLLKQGTRLRLRRTQFGASQRVTANHTILCVEWHQKPAGSHICTLGSVQKVCCSLSRKSYAEQPAS